MSAGGYRLYAGRYSYGISGGTNIIFSPDSIRVQVSGTVSGLASEPYPRGRGETDLDLPRVVCECVGVFQMSYLDYLRIGM